MLQATIDSIGNNPVVKFFGGSQPANCAAADPGTVLGTCNITGASFDTPSGGQMTGTGWSGYADNTGIVGNFRVYENGGSTCHMQGSVSTASGDIIVDDTSISEADSKYGPGPTPISIYALSSIITEGNS